MPRTVSTNTPMRTPLEPDWKFAGELQKRRLYYLNVGETDKIPAMHRREIRSLWGYPFFLGHALTRKKDSDFESAMEAARLGAGCKTAHRILRRVGPPNGVRFDKDFSFGEASTISDYLTHSELVKGAFGQSFSFNTSPISVPQYEMLCVGTLGREDLEESSANITGDEEERDVFGSGDLTPISPSSPGPSSCVHPSAGEIDGHTTNGVDTCDRLTEKLKAIGNQPDSPGVYEEIQQTVPVEDVQMTDLNGPNGSTDPLHESVIASLDTKEGKDAKKLTHQDNKCVGGAVTSSGTGKPAKEAMIIDTTEEAPVITEQAEVKNIPTFSEIPLSDFIVRSLCSPTNVETIPFKITIYRERGDALWDDLADSRSEGSFDSAIVDLHPGEAIASEIGEEISYTVPMATLGAKIFQAMREKHGDRVPSAPDVSLSSFSVTLDTQTRVIKNAILFSSVKSEPSRPRSWGYNWEVEGGISFGTERIAFGRGVLSASVMVNKANDDPMDREKRIVGIVGGGICVPTRVLDAYHRPLGMANPVHGSGEDGADQTHSAGRREEVQMPSSDTVAPLPPPYTMMTETPPRTVTTSVESSAVSSESNNLVAVPEPTSSSYTRPTEQVNVHTNEHNGQVNINPANPMLVQPFGVPSMDVNMNVGANPSPNAFLHPDDYMFNQIMFGAAYNHNPVNTPHNDMDGAYLSNLANYSLNPGQFHHPNQLLGYPPYTSPLSGHPHGLQMQPATVNPLHLQQAPAAGGSRLPTAYPPMANIGHGPISGSPVPNQPTLYPSPPPMAAPPVQTAPAPVAAPLVQTAPHKVPKRPKRPKAAAPRPPRPNECTTIMHLIEVPDVILPDESMKKLLYHEVSIDEFEEAVLMGFAYSNPKFWDLMMYHFRNITLDAGRAKFTEMVALMEYFIGDKRFYYLGFLLQMQTWDEVKVLVKCPEWELRRTANPYKGVPREPVQLSTATRVLEKCVKIAFAEQERNPIPMESVLKNPKKVKRDADGEPVEKKPSPRSQNGELSDYSIGKLKIFGRHLRSYATLKLSRKELTLWVNTGIHFPDLMADSQRWRDTVEKELTSKSTGFFVDNVSSRGGYRPELARFVTFGMALWGVIFAKMDPANPENNPTPVLVAPNEPSNTV